MPSVWQEVVKYIGEFSPREEQYYPVVSGRDRMEEESCSFFLICSL